MIVPKNERAMKCYLSKLFHKHNLKVKSHDFRHTFITKLSKYMSVSEIATYIGHSNTKTTLGYITVDKGDVMEKVISMYKSTGKQQKEEEKKEEVEEVKQSNELSCKGKVK